jgi:hypothetical protein
LPFDVAAFDEARHTNEVNVHLEREARLRSLARARIYVVHPAPYGLVSMTPSARQRGGVFYVSGSAPCRPDHGGVWGKLLKRLARQCCGGSPNILLSVCFW